MRMGLRRPDSETAAQVHGYVTRIAYNLSDAIHSRILCHRLPNPVLPNWNHKCGSAFLSILALEPIFA